MGVFEAGKGQPEVIEALIEKLARDGDAKIGHFGEVRRSHAARRMLLAEDHLPIGTVHRPPGPDASFQRGYRLKASNAASPISYFNIDRDIPLVCGDATNDRRTGYEIKAAIQSSCRAQ